MANYSNHTRKDQVYNYLLVRINRWVDGTELANEQVGGSEGLKRLRELRKDLTESRYEIEMRGHPDPARDIFQYRMIERPREYTDVAPATPMQAVDAAPPSAVDSPPRLNAPVRRSTFQNARGHLVYDEETATYMAVVDGEPAPIPQPDMGVETDDGLKYSEPPGRLEFGKSRPCPKCHGIHKAIHEKGPDGKNVMVPGPKGALHPKVIGYEKLTNNPSKTSETCPRCNGFGLVPA